MRRLPFCIALVLVLTASTAPAQQGAPPQKPDPKTEKSAAPSIAGTWNLSIYTDQGDRYATLKVTLDGKKVSGTIASDMGEAPVAGEYADRKLTFSLTMSTSNGDLSLAFAGALKDDGTLAGTMDYGQGALNWTATRSKEK